MGGVDGERLGREVGEEEGWGRTQSQVVGASVGCRQKMHMRVVRNTDATQISGNFNKNCAYRIRCRIGRACRRLACWGERNARTLAWSLSFWEDNKRRSQISSLSSQLSQKRLTYLAGFGPTDPVIPISNPLTRIRRASGTVSLRRGRARSGW